MSANPIWIAGYFGPIAGAAPVWIAPGDGTVPSAVQSEIVSFFAPVAGATAVWIAGFFAPPPAAIGATPIIISGWGGSGGGGPPPVTSVWSAADAAANGMVLSNGGLTVDYPGAANWISIRSSIGKTAGKLYVEFYVSTSTAGQVFFGLASSSFVITDNLGTTAYSLGIAPFFASSNTVGFSFNYQAASVFPQMNDVWALAVDFTAGLFWFAQNNVWEGGSNPGTGLLPMGSFVPATVGALFAGLSFHTSTQGTWTLQPTAASQKYAPPSGFSAWDGAGTAPSHSPQALAYLARTVGGNEGGNGVNIATLIDGLVSDGVWAKLDCLYVLAQQNRTDAMLNLVGTSYPLTLVGSFQGADPKSMSFVAYVGFSGFSNGSLDTGFNPTTAPSPHYTQNNASFGFWSYAVVVESISPMQIGSSNLGSVIFDNYPGFYARVNYPSTPSVPTTITKGLFAGDRPDASSVHPYQNGVDGGSQAGVSVVPDNADFFVGYSATTQTISAAFIGASLGAAGQLALYNRLRTYMTAVGVP